VNLTERARLQGIDPRTAYRRVGEGTLPVPAVRVNSGCVLVALGAVTAAVAEGRLGLYARVPSHGQEADPGQPVARLAAWAGRAGAEAGSGVNGARSRVRRLLADPCVRVVVAGHRGRLGRVNTELAGTALWAHGRRQVVPGPASPGVTG
jgi:putative resolvase